MLPTEEPAYVSEEDIMKIKRPDNFLVGVLCGIMLYQTIMNNGSYIFAGAYAFFAVINILIGILG